MTLEELVDKLNPEMHQQVRRAIELGKWPDGRSVPAEERELLMQAVIAYEAKHVPHDQRVGYMGDTGDACTPDWLKPQELKWS